MISRTATSVRTAIKTVTNNSQPYPLLKIIRKSSSSSTQQNQSSSIPDSLHPIIKEAYIQANDYIRRDTENLRLEIEKLRSLDKPPADEIERLEILSQINDFSIRDNFNARNIDLSKPIYRFLLNEDWRESGRLGRLMETAHRLRVFPDILPSIDPQVDIKVRFDKLSAGMGSFVPSSVTLQPPLVHAQVFHPGEELYTLLMIDPDVPDPSSKTFTTFLHWLIPNIPISPTMKDPIDLDKYSDSKKSIPYIPPHPPRGSPTHRYTILLLKQQAQKLEEGKEVEDSSSSSSILKLNLSEINRKRFSVRKWVESTNSIPSGFISWLSKWRESESESITSIYRDQLKTREPIYGKEDEDEYKTFELFKDLSISNKNDSSSTIKKKNKNYMRKLKENQPLPLTHRHPRVIPWESDKK